MRTFASLLFCACLAAACTSAQQTPVAPTPSLPSSAISSDSPAPSAPPATTPSPTPTPTPAPTPTPRPADLVWGGKAGISGPNTLYEPRLVHTADGYVLLPTDQASDIYYSADARHWTLADSPVSGLDTVTITDLAAGDSGLVAVGQESIQDANGDETDTRAVVLTSQDGRHWQRISDARFDHAGIQFVGVGARGVAAFGFRSGAAAAWSSPDGRDWVRATDPAATLAASGVHALASVGGQLTAFVSIPGATSEHPLRVEVWQSDGASPWTKVGELPTSGSAAIRQATYGAGRWLAMGVVVVGDYADVVSFAWTSTDGIQWQRHRQDLAIEQVVGLDGGFVAVGSSGDGPGATCGSGAPYMGLTWTSVDGISWHSLPPIKGAAVLSMVGVGGSLIGVGQSISGALVGWTGTLPPTLANPLPEPKPTPTPKPGGGCGP